LRPALRLLLAASLVFGALLIGGSAASAQSSDDYTAQPPPQVAPASANRPAPAVKGASTKAAASSDLPVTGTDVITLVAVGGVLVLAGGAVLVSRRRITQA
jgi:LPXTG-motif cell wall-anchored protein